MQYGAIKRVNMLSFSGYLLPPPNLLSEFPRISLNQWQNLTPSPPFCHRILCLLLCIIWTTVQPHGSCMCSLPLPLFSIALLFTRCFSSPLPPLQILLYRQPLTTASAAPFCPLAGFLPCKQSSSLASRALNGIVRLLMLLSRGFSRKQSCTFYSLFFFFICSFYDTDLQRPSIQERGSLIPQAK